RRRHTPITIGQADDQALPPIEVEHGLSIRGVVVDETGKPVSGATIEGRWTAPAQPSGAQRVGGMSYVMMPSITAKSDSKGEFVLLGIDPGTTVDMEASAGDARTENPIQAAAGARDPVTVRIATSNTVALAGRLVDRAGRAIAGASIRVYSRGPGKDTGDPEP